jgi:hypothetical protein
MWTSSIRQRVEQVDPKTGQSSITYKKLSAYSAVAAAIENVRAAIRWQKPDPLVLSAEKQLVLSTEMQESEGQSETPSEVGVSAD